MNQRDPLQDGISSVQLIDVLGTDLTVVNAARVSMHKESEMEPVVIDGNWNGQERLSEADTKLISYLARHNHWTPFSHPQISLRIKMPIFIARQWFKHQIGFTRNEVSRRYVAETPEFFVPSAWRKRAANVKQGSSEEVVDTILTRVGAKEVPLPPKDLVWSMTNEMQMLYQYLLDEGVCPEQARMVLPQSMYTEFIETGSLAAYARLAKLRLDPHAQLEVRQYAQAVAELIEPLFPISWKALTQ